MPTKQQLIDGLRKAYDAGDIAAANEIASFIDAGRFDPEPEAKEAQPQPGTLTNEEYAERYGDQPDIYGLMKEDEPKPEPSLGEKVVGAGEAALTTATGATGGTLGMLGGTLRGFAEEIRSGEFGTQEAADRIENFAAKMAQEFTYEPRTETGREYVQAVGEAGEALAPLAGLGGELAMIGQTAGRAAAPRAQQAAAQVAEAAKPVTEAAKGVFQYQSPAKQRIAELLENYDSSTDTARYRLSAPSTNAPPQSRILQSIGVGRAKVKSDPVAISAIDQGFDEGVVAMIKGASPADRSAMERMLGIYEKGKKNALYRGKNRPSDIIGDRMVQAISTVRKANRKAGSDIDKAAKNLKGQKIDATTIGERFQNDLADMGVEITPDLKLRFEGSDIEGVAPAERVIKTVFNRMTGPNPPDAYELHRLKRFIDEQVSYGKAGEGLTGRAERALKKLRRDVDSTLDAQFDDYKQANDIYSETIEVLDTVQQNAGPKLDLTGDNANKQLGTLMRRVLSNAQSRVNVMDMAQSLDDAARKYPEQLMIEGPAKGRKPDIASLVLFSDELDSRFGPTARTSLQGQVEQVTNRASRIAQSGDPTMAAVDAVVGGVARGVDRMRGINDEKALEAMRALLREDYDL